MVNVDIIMKYWSQVRKYVLNVETSLIQKETCEGILKKYMAMKYVIDTYRIIAQLGDAYSAMSCQMHQMWIESHKEG